MIRYFRWRLFGRRNYARQLAHKFSPTDLQDAALVAAWRRFVDYDSNANHRRDTDRRLRLGVIYLACVLALLSLISHLQIVGPFAANLKILTFVGALLLLLLATYSFLRSQTNANAEYFAYRLAESLVAREIYLYRLGAGRYLVIDPRERQRLLTKSIKAVEDRVKLMGVRPVSAVVQDDRDLWVRTNLQGVWGREENPFSTILDLERYVDSRILPLRAYYAARVWRANRVFIIQRIVGGMVLVISILFLFQNEPLLFLLGLFFTLALQLHGDVIDDNAARLFYDSTAQRLATQLDEWKLAEGDLPDVTAAPSDLSESARQAREQAALIRARLTSEFIEDIEDTLQFATEMWVLNSFFRAPNSGVNQQTVINDLMENGLVLLNRQKQVSPIRYAKNTIFISYRRADSEDIVGRIWDRLSAYFGQEAIFRDVQTISAGEDFEKRILSAVESCSVLLTIIGAEWERIADAETGTARLHNPKDYVRREIVAALTRTDAVVVPVLVRGAKMPTRDHLPDDLQDLTMRNSVPVRSDPDFEGDIKRLINAIELSVSRQA